jgi:hypothetical protein
VKKPSDGLHINQEEQNELEFEMCRVAFAYMEMGMSETTAFDLAEMVIEIQVMSNLKNELEDVI